MKHPELNLDQEVSRPLKVLVACESSGIVREAFNALGHLATSCDMLDTVLPGDHYTGNVEDILDNKWDLIIAHPPCTYLCSSGMHWTTRGLRDPQLTEDALEFVRLFMGANCPRIAIENPVGCISTRIRKADQYIQPHEFGEDASKRTGLWLKGLNRLVPTLNIPPRIVNGKKRWANQTDSGQNKLAPSNDRWRERSKTYEGIASAMAAQWGGDTGWRRVSFAMDCHGYDEETGELGDICSICGLDYCEDCQCPGPTQDGYDHSVFHGVLMARAETTQEPKTVLCPPRDASILMRALARR